jgi:large subunit ribosomal protein L21
LTENTFMYAVMKTGGKQYKVAPGKTLKVEKINADVGTSVDFNNVLMVADGQDIRIGTPNVEGGQVIATVINQGRGKKVNILKFKRRKHHLKRMGHRQSYTELRVTSIMADGIQETWQPPEKPKTEEVQEPIVEAMPSDIVAAEVPNVDATPSTTEADAPKTEVSEPETSKKD